jgi:hypothetical protein
MSTIGGRQHEAILDEAILEMQKKGWRIIRLDGKSPDAIAVKDGRIVALEVMGRTWRQGKGWDLAGHGTFQTKKQEYSMFDEIMFWTFRYVH